ncbi:MAG: two-component regulator propeller domain-containing protein [Haliscomenobacter sp.]|uniref:hybrid sensor histidine kinase/response regulator transcription factor n=1 Tax=Haliscomenobacter sp. TaxID=2717303 RepID=UPI0029B57863|nr:two-component regulator propeller domain-containing protein [Haliscomenobacter sp.]MDX2072613.1 two-component regulator propeller domain-containing protein [Haliscomenobacter sp.]
MNSAHGLSQGMIYDILQDKQGFLWYGTRGGLNRFDGYGFKAFKPDPFNPFSISDNTIQAILEDHQGRLWLGTENNGVDVYDPRIGRFYHLKAGDNGLSNSNVVALAEAPDGAIWVGTRNGLNKVQLKELPKQSADLSGLAKVTIYNWEQSPGKVPFGNVYQSLLCTKDGILWVGTLHQAYRFDLSKGTKEILPTYEPDPNSPWQTNVFAQDPQGNVWLGQNTRVIRFKSKQQDLFTFPSAEAPYQTYLAFDQEGNLYVGRRKSVYFFSKSDLSQNRKVEPKIFTSFPPTGVIGSTDIVCDRNGLIWIGTNGYGVRKYNLVNQFFKHLIPGISTRTIYADQFGQVWAWESSAIISRIDEKSKTSVEPFLPANEFYNHDLFQARDSTYWFLGESRAGPSGTGFLIQKNPKTGFVQRYPSPVALGIFSQIIEDRKGNIWICGRESTLARFDVRIQKFSTFSFSDITGFKEASYAIQEDHNGQLWVGTPHGLVRGILDKKGQMAFSVYRCNPAIPNSLSNDVVLSVCDDPRNPETRLWVGTRGGGLNALDKKTGECRHYNTNDGLPDDVIYGILPDEHGSLWLSTNSGLSKFTPQNKHFENYSAADGLQDNEFNTISYAKGHDSRLFFGGVNGITAFYPEKISPNAEPPKVFITALKINNKITLPGEGILQQNIENTSVITLRYYQNHLTLDFVAMDFAEAHKNQFRYRLKGADKVWIESTTSHSVNYSNLAPGHYTFEVSSGGTHGVWPSQPSRTLQIRVLPPWWRSPLAFLLYVLGIVWGSYRYIKWRIRRAKNRSQREFEKRELERIQELEQLKSNFFTNITHELRTPITLVIEPLRQIVNQPAAENWLSKVQIAERSGSKLLHLVNQLLDLAKLEGGAMKLENSWGSLDHAIINIASDFKEAALRKHIDLVLNPSEIKVGQSFFDFDKLEKIISNLLANALKYTPEGGRIQLQWYAEPVQAGQKTLFVEVSDTGPGISPEHQLHIFERFYTLDRTGFDEQVSTGVGLSLCKELTEIMGGQIEVESTLGAGALFRLRLPLHVFTSTNQMMPLHRTDALTKKITQYESSLPERTLVLVVEDNDEFREFLVQTLLEDYEVISAINGKIAFEMACEHIPDVIISDLLMPEVDGLGFLRLLKGEQKTSHIPLVLLTAKSSLENRIEGLRHGAEAYLPKPFNTQELKAWIETLLENRRKLQLGFKQALNGLGVVQQNKTPQPLTNFNPLDQEFLQRLEQIISQEMENENLNVEDLARLMFISRSQLHRKVIALTGLSSTELIRKSRLEYAWQLLKTEGGKISDIAQRVGFRNVKYFSTAFKEYFGMSPSDI